MRQHPVAGAAIRVLPHVAGDGEHHAEANGVSEAARRDARRDRLDLERADQDGLAQPDRKANRKLCVAPAATLRLFVAASGPLGYRTERRAGAV